MLLSMTEITNRLYNSNVKYNRNYKFNLPAVYTGVHQKILAECEYGHIFPISIDNAYRGKGCPECANIATSERCRLSPNDALASLQRIWGNTYEFIDIHNYKSAHKKLQVRCSIPEHGIFHASYANLYSGKGCPKCGIISTANKRRFSPQQALINIRSIHGVRYSFPNIKTEYTHATAKLTAVCQHHGTFTTDYDQLMQGMGCPTCGRIKAKLSTRNVIFQPNLADYESYHSRILITDCPAEGIYGELQVRCKFCNEFMIPTLDQVLSRIHAINTTGSGECNFYCSDDCKDKCSVYGKHSDIHYLAQNIPDYEAKVKLARNCQYQTKTILRQQQMDMWGYHFCEKCGIPVDNPELHHTIEVAKDPSGAITIAGQMLVCEECHKELTRQCK